MSYSRVEVFRLSGTRSNGSNNRIQRAKTAISRNDFSTPVRHLLETGILTKKRSFFDYGCGKGDDFVGLESLGFVADGWDPEHWPQNRRVSAEVVNLGFVLNVIEDRAERKRVLREAWELASRVLMVSVISKSNQDLERLTPFSDGTLTKRSTFQRFFAPGELKSYVDACLGVDSIPVSPFAIICFKDRELEQYYLSNVTRRTRWEVPVPVHPLRKSGVGRCLEHFRLEWPMEWRRIVEEATYYAMPPAERLVAEHEMLSRNGVRAADVLKAVAEMFGETEWSRVVNRVRDRYISRIALGFFRGTPRAKHFLVTDRTAIRAHFGSFAVAGEIARETLFRIGDPSAIDRCCTGSDVGVSDEQALYVHRSCVVYLDSILQTYIGVGRLFYGSLEDVDVFKIHRRSGKLTLLLYEDFEGSERPLLMTRVKIDYRARRVSYYDHRRDGERLDFKDHYMCLRDASNTEGFLKDS